MRRLIRDLSEAAVLVFFFAVLLFWAKQAGG